MPVQLVFRSEQLNDLRVLLELGAETIKAISLKLSSLEPPPFRPSDLRQALNDSLPGRANDASVIMRLLMHFYTLRRRRNLTVDELLEGISYGVTTAKEQWKEKEIAHWKALAPQLHELFSLTSVWTVVKALDLSYDYAYLLQHARIITDVRPVFSEGADQIDGTIISHTLRLYYDSINGSESVSIALDEKDIETIRKACERAIKKAHTAKTFMQSHDVKSTFICGEEE